MAVQSPRPCPCGSGKPYPECCARFLSGQALPPTAEALMRSRYTAHARQDVAYILKTTHPRNRGRHDEAKIRAWVGSVVWKRLDILDTQKGKPNDTEGIVEFQAWYIDDDGLQCLCERSNFEKVGPAWLYVDGKHMGQPKLPGYAPCPCGSGKRYESCCIG